MLQLPCWMCRSRSNTASASLLDEIDEKMRLSAAGETWEVLREEMRAAALQDWVARDLGAAFSQ